MMKIQETKLIVILLLLLTIIINVLLISHTYDFSIVSLLIKSQKNIYSFVNGDDKIVNDLYESFSKKSYFDKRNTILNITGKINDYRVLNILDNFKLIDNKLSLKYEIETDLIPDGICISMIYNLIKERWKLSDIQIEPRSAVLESSDLIKENNNYETTRKIADKVVKAYVESNYNYIYSIMCEEHKRTKTKEDLFFYLKSANKKYGNLSSNTIPIIESNKNGGEYKFTYWVEDERNNTLSLIIWIIEDNGIYLSGIKFAENVW